MTSNTTPASGVTVALLEDDAIVRMGTELFLDESGYGVVAGGSADALSKAIASSGRRPEILVSDYRLGGATALDAVEQVMKALGERIPVVITTGDTTSTVRDEIARRGWRLLLKPYRASDLLSLLEQASPPAA
ncbi:response regulator [Azospirillum sp. SYSU D00513]|uniref:response regulator n=1 Tax=Azospirillum sp. SYSU D00513 TaxID=2812561 RepID=UPI001A95D988|nr:response regulator [Azospirillum sp. SYSU D00513]